MNTVSARDFAPFGATQADIDSEKEMLLETAIDGLNDYLLDQMGNSDLVHD